MSRPPASTAPAVDAPPIDALLRDLGPWLRRGGLPAEPLVRFPTGLPEIDRLLAGGFPRGRLSEIAGPASSGRTSLALALLARTSGAGETCAVVDGADGFDPASARAAGAALERVLWVRAPRRREALRAAERLLETPGFALVLLQQDGSEPQLGAAAWTRLARAAAGTGAALVVLSLERALGASAEVALEMRALRAHFSGTPSLLEGLEAEALLVRQRAAPAEQRARVRLHSRRTA